MAILYDPYKKVSAEHDNFPAFSEEPAKEKEPASKEEAPKRSRKKTKKEE